MNKHSNHVIDEEAVEIFKGLLPKDRWTIYDLKPDYGKDHKVESVENGEHTGLTFWIQLKGQKTLKILRDGNVSFNLETKYLDYFKKLPEPMFLVVVDVAKRLAFWVFIQEYEQTKLRNVSWRPRGPGSLHDRVSNPLR